MKGERGNEEERDFTHRVATTEFLLNPMAVEFSRNNPVLRIYFNRDPPHYPRAHPRSSSREGRLLDKQPRLKGQTWQEKWRRLERLSLDLDSIPKFDRSKRSSKEDNRPERICSLDNNDLARIEGISNMDTKMEVFRR